MAHVPWKLTHLEKEGESLGRNKWEDIGIEDGNGRGKVGSRMEMGQKKIWRGRESFHLRHYFFIYIFFFLQYYNFPREEGGVRDGERGEISVT